MTDKKILVLDIDGTLVNSEKKDYTGDTEIFEDDTGAGTYCCTGIGQTISGVEAVFGVLWGLRNMAAMR